MPSRSMPWLWNGPGYSLYFLPNLRGFSNLAAKEKYYKEKWGTPHPPLYSDFPAYRFLKETQTFARMWGGKGHVFCYHGNPDPEAARCIPIFSNAQFAESSMCFHLSCGKPRKSPIPGAWQMADVTNTPHIGIAPNLVTYGPGGEVIDYPIMSIGKVDSQNGRTAYIYTIRMKKSRKALPFNESLALYRGKQTPWQKLPFLVDPSLKEHPNGLILFEGNINDPVITNLGKGYGKAQCSEPKPVPLITRIAQNINNASQNTVRFFSGAGRAIKGAGGAIVKTMGPDIVGGVRTGGLQSAGVSPPVAGLVGIGGTLIATAGVEGTLGPAVSYLGAKGTLAIAGAGGGGVVTTAVLGGSLFGAGCSIGVEHQCQEEIKAMKKNGISGPAALGNFHGSKW